MALLVGTSSSVSTTRGRQAEQLQRISERAQEVIADLSEAYERYQRVCATRHARALQVSPLSDASPTNIEEELTAAHGALAFSFVQGQQLARVLTHVAAPSPPRTESGVTSLTVKSASAQISAQQFELKRLLPRAAVLLEKHGKEASAGGSAADAAAAMRSLVHTRSLLSMELQKVDAVVQRLAGSAESVSLLQQTLQDVTMTVEVAQEALKQLLTVKSKEDLVLRLSAAIFVLVVVYIAAQRVFGFFPVTRYVRL